MSTTEVPYLAIESRPFPAGIVVEKNVRVRMRDGVQLALNVYRPATTEPVPVIMAFTPYGKDRGPDAYDVCHLRVPRAMSAGKIAVSSETSFEAPDPAWWCPRGYAVAVADVRGFYASKGYPFAFSDAEVEDYAELIEWAGTQPWSNGRVGLCGVSYLAINQWFAAAERPAHLHAIVIWEGMSDPANDALLHGGIPETAFSRFWGEIMRKGARHWNPMFSPQATAFAQRYPALLRRFARKPRLERITAPALVCASWSDQGLHTRGSLRGYERIASTQKWLYTHGGKKWEKFYADEALALQQRFFACFLKGEADAMRDVPRVSLEVRETRQLVHVRAEQAWPPPSAHTVPLYLDTLLDVLGAEPPPATTTRTIDAASDASLHFEHRFEHDTELTGAMRLVLYVRLEETPLADLFVAVHKRDVQGHEVTFEGFDGNSSGPVALGWRRVRKPRGHGGVLEVVVEILPSSTLFRAGESLRLVLASRDIQKHERMRHDSRPPRGRWVLVTGPHHASRLEIPVVERAEARA